MLISGRFCGGAGQAFVDPALWQLPNLDRLVLAARDKLLELLVPPHLRDGTGMGLDYVEGGALLHVPDGQVAVLVTRNDLAVLISPDYKSLLRATDHLADLLRQLFHASLADVADRNDAVDVCCDQQIRCALFLRYPRYPIAVQVEAA